MARPTKETADQYSEQEAQRRFMSALKAAVNTPPKPLKGMGPKGVSAQSKKRRKKIINPKGNRLAAVAIDVNEIVQKLASLLRNCEAGVFANLCESIASLSRKDLAGFFCKLAKPAYVTVNGTADRIAELRFSLPGGANELLAALRTYEANKD
jgi:hypothetical protein